MGNCIAMQGDKRDGPDTRCSLGKRVHETWEEVMYAIVRKSVEIKAKADATDQQVNGSLGRGTREESNPEMHPC